MVIIGIRPQDDQMQAMQADRPPLLRPLFPVCGHPHANSIEAARMLQVEHVAG